jgi:glycosyltransferase involved in cell wall biosynthesis
MDRSPDEPTIAWFSPMPPARSGVAIYSAEVVAALRREYSIDVYVDGPRTPVEPVPGAPAARTAHDFVGEHIKRPYDLIVYQLGNSSHHDYLWPYLFRYPGLVVLHDVHLHHARAAALLRTKRAVHYREEFHANHPAVSVDVAEVAVAGFDTHLLYEWPMTKLVVEAARLTAVHAPGMAAMLREASPSAAIETIRLGHGEAVTAERRRLSRERVRRERRIPDNAILFAVAGALTPEKRVAQVLDAFAAIRPYVPDGRVLLAGAPAAHYDVAKDVSRRGLDEAVIITGYIEDEHALTEHLCACDVSLNLRWPTAHEVSGPWVRALGAGVPTITTELAHLADVPSIDPRTWMVSHSAVVAEQAPEPVTVAVDILDEDHSLRLAMRRLASDAGLRERLGSAGQRYWQERHSHDGMLADYRRVIAAARDIPVANRSSATPPTGWPDHLLDCADSRLRTLLAPFGLPPERSTL